MDRIPLNNAVTNPSVHVNNNGHQVQTDNNGQDNNGRNVRQQIDVQNPNNEHNPLPHISSNSERLIVNPQQNETYIYSAQIVTEIDLISFLDENNILQDKPFNYYKDHIQHACDAFVQYLKKMSNGLGTGNQHAKAVDCFDAFLAKCIENLTRRQAELETSDAKESGYFQPKSQFALTCLLRACHNELKGSNPPYEQIFIFMIKAISSCECPDVTAKKKEELFFTLLKEFLPSLKQPKNHQCKASDSFLMLFLNPQNASICQLIDAKNREVIKDYLLIHAQLETYQKPGAKTLRKEVLLNIAKENCATTNDELSAEDRLQICLKEFNFFKALEGQHLINLYDFHSLLENALQSVVLADSSKVDQYRYDFERTILALSTQNPDSECILVNYYLERLYFGKVAKEIIYVYEKWLNSISWESSKHKKLDVYYYYVGSYNFFGQITKIDLAPGRALSAVATTIGKFSYLEHGNDSHKLQQKILDLYEAMMTLFVKNDRPELALNLGIVLYTRSIDIATTVGLKIKQLLNRLENLDYKGLPLKEYLKVAISFYENDATNKNYWIQLKESASNETESGLLETILDRLLAEDTDTLRFLESLTDLTFFYSALTQTFMAGINNKRPDGSLFETSIRSLLTLSLLMGVKEEGNQ